MTLEVLERDENRRLVRSIVDAKKVFSCRWEFVLEPALGREGATRVTIREHGEVSNPFSRAMASFCMPADKYLHWYLTNLARRFGHPSPAVETTGPAPSNLSGP